MRARIQKNSAIGIAGNSCSRKGRAVSAALLFLLPFIWLAFSTSPAQAYTFNAPVVMYNQSNGAKCPDPAAVPPSNGSCNNIFDTSGVIVCPNPDFTTAGLVRRIMPCIKETILVSVQKFLTPFSADLGVNTTTGVITGVVGAACTLSIILLGVMVVGGKSTASLKDVAVLAVKLGAVAYFEKTIFFWFGQFLDIIDEMVAKVTWYSINGTSFFFFKDCGVWTGILKADGSANPGNTDAGTVLEIWDLMDCTVEMLLGGVFWDNTITMGFLGFLLACLVSKGLGITIGLMGMYMIVQFLWAMVRTLYIFLMGYFGVVLCMIVAPLFIPTILFQATKGYFMSWVQALGGFMLQPVIIAAYMGMLLSAFDIAVFYGDNSLTVALAGKKVVQHIGADGYPDFENNGGIGYWMFSSGGYASKWLGTTAVNIDATQAINLTGAPDYGMVGNMASVGDINKNNPQFLDWAGVGSAGSHASHYGIDIPVASVNWDLLANINNYTGATQEEATNSYLLALVQAAISTFLVGYIFLQILEIMPFISAALTLGSGGGSSWSGKSLGLGGLNPGSNILKNMKSKKV